MRELIEAQKDLGSQDVQAAKIGELAKKLKDMNMQQAKDRSTIEKVSHHAIYMIECYGDNWSLFKFALCAHVYLQQYM